MTVTIIPIVIGALGTVTKGFVQGLEDLEITEQVEITQNTALLRSARMLRIDLEIKETCYSKSTEKPWANIGVKNSQKRINHFEIQTSQIISARISGLTIVNKKKKKKKSDYAECGTFLSRQIKE